MTMQGNAHDEEYIDPHGECREEIRKLQNREAVLRASLTELLDACVEDAGPGDDGDGDDESVGASTEGPMALTFGMMRRAAAALKE